jgi:hypothetical protein
MLRWSFVMRAVFGNPVAVATEIQGRFRPGRDKIVTRYFGVVARALWPDKTAAHVAAICDCDERQAKRYLSGEYPVPYIMLRHINDRMLGLE